MVYTITLNPALDCYLSPEAFAPGQENRYGALELHPGGKGVNVALLLSSLGCEAVAMGIAAGSTGRELQALLAQAGCHTDLLFLKEGLTRLNLKVKPHGQPETALNGAGPEIPMEAMELLEQKLATALRQGDYLVLSGSLPRGLPADTYARLARTTPRDVKVVIDAAGPALEEGLPAKPFLVKPNLDELGQLFGEKLENAEAALPYAQKLQRMGAKNVAVSMGSRGVLLVAEDGRTLTREALPGQEVSPVGAGDSMVAGFLYGWMKSGDIREALDWGVAAGAATAFTQGVAGGREVRRLYEAAFAGA